MTLGEPPARNSGPEAGHLTAAVFSTSSDAIVVVDAEGSIVLSSAAVTRLFGYFPEELVGEPVELLVPEAARNGHATHRKRFVEAARARQMGTGLQLYGRARNGEEVPIDVSLAPTEVNGRRYVAAFVRDARERVRTVRQLEAIVDVTRQLLAGASIEESIALILERACELADASTAWLVTKVGDELRITSALGRSERLVGATLSATTSRSAQVLETGEIDLVENLSSAVNIPAAADELDLGPGVYLPLSGGERPAGVLVVARDKGQATFEPGALNTLRLFSAAAAVTLALGGTRHELERLRLIEEDERIARDLHDTIVQRAFAVGMSLEAVRRLASGPVLERIDAAVDGLDEMIRDLRNAIFRLSHPLEAGTTRTSLTELAEELTGQLGFRPRLAFRGAVDDDVRGELAGELLAVAREAVSNVARHARASRLDIAVLVEDGWLILAVTDDGVGLGAARKAGNGLANMAERADRRGGTFEIARAEPSGTALTWRVPLAS